MVELWTDLWSGKSDRSFPWTSGTDLWTDDQDYHFQYHWNYSGNSDLPLDIEAEKEDTNKDNRRGV
jgi:hypothetical protein